MASASHIQLLTLHYTTCPTIIRTDTEIIMYVVNRKEWNYRLLLLSVLFRSMAHNPCNATHPWTPSSGHRTLARSSYRRPSYGHLQYTQVRALHAKLCKQVNRTGFDQISQPYSSNIMVSRRRKDTADIRRRRTDRDRCS